MRLVGTGAEKTPEQTQEVRELLDRIKKLEAENKALIKKASKEPRDGNKQEQ